MTRDAFETYTKISLELLVQFAESKVGKTLPRNILFSWDKEPSFDDIISLKESQVIDTIVNKVYMEEGLIFPCVDLEIKKYIPFERLFVSGRVAGFEPRPFQKGIDGRPGPFVFGVNQKFIDTY